MKCSIIQNEYDKEVKSNLYQKLLGDNTPEQALDKLYKGMVFAGVNNGKYVATTIVEALQVKSELAQVFGEDVSYVKGLNTYDIFIKRPKFLEDEDIVELNDMDAVKKSTIYKQSQAQQQKDKIIEVVEEDKAVQGTLSDKLNETRSKLEFDDEGKVALTEGEEDEKTGKKFLHYTLKTGEFIAKRVSSLTQAIFTRNKDAKQLKEIEKNSEPNRQIGSAAHEVMEKTMAYLASKSDKTMAIGTNGQVDGTTEKGYEPSFMHGDNVKLQEAAEKLFNYITQTQDKINELTGDPSGKARIYIENLVYDSKKDMGGSIDLMVSYSDGSVSLYDYKFIQMKTYTDVGGVTVMADQWIGKGKEEAFNMQIGEYKRILRDFYGVENFRESRIIPAHISVDKDAQTTDMKEMLNGITILDPNVPQVLPIPVAGERAQNKYAQELVKNNKKRIKDLEEERKELYKKQDTSGRKEAIKLEIEDLKKSNQAILVNDDFSLVIKDLQRMVNSIDENVENGLTLPKVSEFLTYIKVYDHVIPNVKSRLSEEDRKKMTEVDDNLRMRREMLQDQLESMIHDGTPAKPVKEMGFVQQYLTNLSMYRHPIFLKFRELVKSMFFNVQKETKLLAEEAQEIKNVAQSWADKKGIKLMEVYQLMIDPNSGKLISEFNQDFFNAQKEAKAKKDIKWFRQNYDITGQEQYEKDYKEYATLIESYFDKGSKQYNAVLDNWARMNNLAKSADAWFNNGIAVYKYATKKTNKKWSDDAYLQIQNEPELKQVYDWLVKKNQDFNTRVSEKIDNNFVANIQKNFVQTIAHDGNIWQAFKDHGKSLHQGLQVRANDTVDGSEQGEKIPLLYYDSFRFMKGDEGFKEARASRSDDLIYNTVLFGHQVFMSQERHRIEDRAQAMRILLKDTKALKTDWKGSIALDDEKESIELENDKKAIAAFDAMVGNYVYGRSIQSKDRLFKFNGNVYSGNKILLKLMSYMSVKSLAFNYVSGLGNLGGAYLNSFIKSTGGQFYTKKQLFTAHKMLIKRPEDDAYNRISEYFNVERDFWAKEEADKLSASAITRNLTYDKWYLLQQKGDEFVANSVLMAMMQNYGLDENGQIQKLADLPENANSLLDKYKIVDDKVVIDGLSDAAYTDFRNRVKYVSRSVKGTNTAEDISVIQTEVWGRSVMHFRNWIAPMVKERFGKANYSQEVKDWEFGRFSLLFNELGNNYKKTSLEVLKSLLLFKKVNLSDSDAEAFIKKYNRENNTKLSADQYLKAKEQQLQTAVTELRVMSAIMIILVGLGWEDDDGEKFYQQFTGGRHLMKVANRVYNELSFFVNPASAKEILKSPIPVMRVVEDLYSVLSNTFDETRDMVLGENQDYDVSPIGSKSSKLVPIVPWVIDVISDFMKED